MLQDWVSGGCAHSPFFLTLADTLTIALLVPGSLLDYEFPTIPGTQQNLGTWWEFMKRNNKWTRHFSFLLNCLLSFVSFKKMSVHFFLMHFSDVPKK